MTLEGETNQKGVEFQGSGQDPNASGEQQTTQPPEQGAATPGEGLTKDQVLALINEKVDAASKKTLSKAQSMVDKADNRLTKQMKAKLAPIDEILDGSNLTAEQKSVVRNEIIETLSGETEASGQEAPGQAPAKPGGTEVDPITALGLELQKEAGMYINENDPELSMVKVKGTPKEYIDSLNTAIAAKKERVGTSGGSGDEEPGEGGEKTPGGDPAARMPGLGTGGTKPNPIANITDPKELFDMGSKKG